MLKPKKRSTATYGQTSMVSEPGKIPTSYTNSKSWKSKTTRLADDFHRMQSLARYIAPEQFRNPARPSNGPCSIVPTTLLEYIEHVKDMLQMQTEDKQKKLAIKKELMRARHVEGYEKLQILSCFGGKAKVYADGLSPVLCQCTMWSAEYDLQQKVRPRWPSQAELQRCGDKRENEMVSTRCGRYLPLPKTLIQMPRQDIFDVDRGLETTGHTTRNLLPFDEPGPIFVHGPTPFEVTSMNGIFDQDRNFEDRGKMLLGDDLMAELGEWMLPYVPDWLAMKRQQYAYEQSSALNEGRHLRPAAVRGYQGSSSSVTVGDGEFWQQHQWY